MSNRLEDCLRDLLGMAWHGMGGVRSGGGV